MLEKTTIVLAIAALAGLAGGPLLAYAGLLPPLAGLALFAASGLAGLAAMIAAAAAAILRRAYFPAMIGMLGCLPFVAVAAAGASAARYPAINDITTNLADPPVFRAAAALPANADRDMAFPESFADPIRAHYPALAPLALATPPDQTYGRVRSLAVSNAFNWKIVAEEPGEGRLEAVAETRLFRWKDDIVIRIRPDGQGGSIVDMRSKSREGKGDLGANARRIRKFFEALAG